MIRFRCGQIMRDKGSVDCIVTLLLFPSLEASKRCRHLFTVVGNADDRAMEAPKKMGVSVGPGEGGERFTDLLSAIQQNSKVSSIHY